MTIQKTIEKAIEGGWEMRMTRTTNSRYDLRSVFPVKEDGNFPITWIYFEASEEAKYGRFVEKAEISLADLLLDYKFWQSLGKALGWNEKDGRYCPYCGYDAISGGWLASNPPTCPQCRRSVPDWWLYQWHRFIDHLASGKSAESFFEQF